MFCYIFRLSYSKNNQIKTACGQQLHNCILVGIHLNLIRGTWPRINLSQCSFCCVKVYLYNKIIYFEGTRDIFKGLYRGIFVMCDQLNLICETWIYEIIVRDLWSERFAWLVKNFNCKLIFVILPLYFKWFWNANPLNGQSCLLGMGVAICCLDVAFHDFAFINTLSIVKAGD